MIFYTANKYGCVYLKFIAEKIGQRAGLVTFLKVAKRKKPG